jgi:hypothetical protein
MSETLLFGVQKHHPRTHHFDLRLEKDGAGVIRVWDRGCYSPVEWDDDKIVFDATGTVIVVRYTLVRFNRGGPRELLLVKSTPTA